MSKWTPAWLTCTKSAMSSSAWRNSCLVLLVRPHLTPCIRSGNPVTMRRSGAASKSVKLIAVKMSKAISRSCKHLATPVPCKCCRIQKNAFLQFSTLSGTSCSGNAFSNLVWVLETRARKHFTFILKLCSQSPMAACNHDPASGHAGSKRNSAVHLLDSRIHLDLPSPDPAHAALAGSAKDCMALNVALAGTAKSHPRTRTGTAAVQSPTPREKKIAHVLSLITFLPWNVFQKGDPQEKHKLHWWHSCWVEPNASKH